MGVCVRLEGGLCEESGSRRLRELTLERVRRELVPGSSSVRFFDGITGERIDRRGISARADWVEADMAIAAILAFAASGRVSGARERMD